MDGLRIALQGLRQYQKDDSCKTLRFVPERALFSLLTAEKVRGALADPAFKLERHRLDPLTSEVVDVARKIFAILIELRIEDRLAECLERCLTDTNLPIAEKTLNELFPESASLFWKLQWEYVPLKFREGSHKNIESDRVLPFIEDEELSSGGSSKVFRVKIHADSWEYHSKDTVRFSYYLL
jgi:hypothetical protein